MNKITSNKNILGYIAVLIWPLIYCFRFVISGESFSQTISNDFYYLYDCKVYLLDKLSNFEIPFWSPSEGCGYPFFSNPFTQTFYPLNFFLTAFYKIAGGYSYADHQKFTIIGLSIFSAGLLLWLRLFNIKMFYAVIAVCIAAVSSKVTEILRFPTAVHTVAWIPFILYGCTLALDSTKKFKASLIIFASTVMLITAGYPYNAYHSLFLIFPYIILIAYLKEKNICFKDSIYSFKKFLTVIIVSFTAAAVICYPYIKGIRNLFDQISFRKGEDFGFATFYKFNFSDTIGSLIYPPASPIEGWYYFGITGLLIIFCGSLILLIKRKEYKIQLIIFGIIFLWFVIISYITYGENSYLFRLLWNYFPGFSRIRIWGRMNIIFIPAIAFLIAYSLTIMEKYFSETPIEKTEKFISSLKLIIPVIAVFCLVIFLTQYHFFSNRIEKNFTISYSKTLYQELNEKSFLIISIISFGVIILFISFSKLLIRNKLYSAAVILLFVLNITDLYNAGSMQWALKKSPDITRKILNINDIDMQSLSTPRVNKMYLISLTPEFHVGSVDEWYFENYNKFLSDFKNSISEENMESSLLSFDELLGISSGKRFFCSKSINFNKTYDFTEDSKNFEAANSVNVITENYTGDELICSVDFKEPGYFSFIDNYDKGWKAEVNGKETEIEKLFGTFKSLKLGTGMNRIRLRYCPEFF